MRLCSVCRRAWSVVDPCYNCQRNTGMWQTHTIVSNTTSHSHNMAYIHWPENDWPEQNTSYGDYGSIRAYTPAPTKKEYEMGSALQEIARERRLKRERAKIDAQFEAYDTLSLNDQDDGTVVRFAWTPQSTIYRYVAIFTDGSWFITGSASPKQGISAEEFIAFLVEKNIGPLSVRFMKEDLQ